MKKKSSKNIGKVEYLAGDSVEVWMDDDEESYVKILELYKEKNRSSLNLAKVRWYYSPKDVFKNNIPPFISKSELFESDFEQTLEISTFKQKVAMLSLEAYHDLSEVESSVFFTRAHWAHLKKEMTPPLSQWKRICSCQSIVNPDLTYIYCDSCQNLYHKECLVYNETLDLNHCEKCKASIENLAVNAEN